MMLSLGRGSGSSAQIRHALLAVLMGKPVRTNELAGSLSALK